MKREPAALLERAIDSLVLSVEKFNCPWDRGRPEVVLILLDRAFELLLKAVIVHRGGRIREPKATQTIGFDKCVRICLSEASVKCLTDEQALTVQVINSLRDAAQHYLVELSEQQLYLYCQAGVTLFADILKAVFKQKLHDVLPTRVLPVASAPPRDLHSVLKAEFDDVKSLLVPRSRKTLRARAKLRALAIVEASVSGVRSQPGERELDRLIDTVRQSTSWRDVFPGVAALSLETEGSGLTVSIRLTKAQGEPVRLVPEGTPGATTVAVRRVDELGFYNLGLAQVADKLKMSPPRALALVKHLDLQSDSDCFKEIRIGKVAHKRYSQVAIAKLRAALPITDVDAIWERHKPQGRRRHR
ncbi:DUF3644 domain-containing protein [Gemmatimonas sp.]|uniref:DUF3644 domain-containing protein n=1 Tax=Gemmatimonas sp. TaxID=1962908 RepID=UPI003DA22230